MRLALLGDLGQGGGGFLLFHLLQFLVIFGPVNLPGSQILGQEGSFFVQGCLQELDLICGGGQVGLALGLQGLHVFAQEVLFGAAALATTTFACFGDIFVGRLVYYRRGYG